MNKVQYDDLIGCPYLKHTAGPVTYDCVGVVREVYARAGWSVDAIPTAANEAACLASIGGEASGLPWDPVDAVTGGTVTGQLAFGDIVMIHGNGATHVSVVVDESRQLAISSAGHMGVYACGASRLSRVAAVYRLQESAR